MPTVTHPALAQLLQHLQCGHVVAITGAGLSTGSGIPAYRDAAGQRLHRHPIQHHEFMRSALVRRRYWARSFMGWPRMLAAQPNAGHLALSAMEQAGWIRHLITQNVDDLHARAGTQCLTELHGNLKQVVCMGCQAVHGRQQMQTWLEALNPGFSPKPLSEAPDGDVNLEDASYEGFQFPDCPICGGILKPDVVFFGDNVPRTRVETSAHEVDQASAILIVGSSLMVYSGFRFIQQAHQRQIPILAINQGHTRADDLLSLKIEMDCSATLAHLINVA